MRNTIPDGVYPTMLTPFTADDRIDSSGVAALLEWYDRENVAGVFAVCQSSEMFFLSREERLELTKFIVDHAPKRFTIVASGHVDDTPEEQVEYAKAALDTGIDAYVFISNQFAAPEEGDDVFRRSVERMLSAIPGGAFGIYECPHPYKRLVTPENLRWCAQTGRFTFLKDTCCSLEGLRAKAEAVGGTGMKIFNANAATLLESLRMGCAGYSGVMANFHAAVYAWLCRNFAQEPEKAEKVQAFLGAVSMTECQEYPPNAKYMLSLEGVPIRTKCRVRDDAALTQSKRMEIEQLRTATAMFRTCMGI